MTVKRKKNANQTQRVLSPLFAGWAGSLENTANSESCSLSNMCNSTSELLVTHTLTQSNRPFRLPFAVWSATCWTNPNPSSHHSTTCTCPNIWYGSWSTCGSNSDLFLSLSTCFCNWPMDPYCLLQVQHDVSGTTNQGRYCRTA